MEPATSTPTVSTAASPHPADGASSQIQTGASPPASPDRHLLAFIADTDHPCPNCGYNLRGLRASVCPECSQQLKLTIGLVEPKLGAWLAGVIGLAVGAGFSVMMVGYLIFQTAYRGGGPFQMLEVTFVIVLPAIFLSACLLALLVKRQRFRKLGLATRIALAITCWLLTLANLIVFSLVIK